MSIRPVLESDSTSADAKLPPQGGVNGRKFTPGPVGGKQVPLPKSPVAGGVAIFQGNVTGFLEKIQAQLRGAFFVRKMKREIPRLTGVNQAVLDLASKSGLSTEQVINNFNETALAMDSIASTLVQINMLEADNEGKPISRQMSEVKRQLEELANTLSTSMEAFTECGGYHDALETVEEDSEVETQILNSSDAFYEKAEKAIGMANFDKAAQEATAALEAFNQTLQAGTIPTEEQLRTVLASASGAMKTLEAAQSVADRTPLKLSSKATKNKSRLAKRIGQRAKGIATIVRSTAASKPVEAALAEARQKQEVQAKEIEERVAAGEDPEDIETVAYAAEIVEEVAATEAQIEEGPKPEFAEHQLSPDEQALVGKLEKALECEDDGIDPRVKGFLKDFITRGLLMNQRLANLEGDMGEEMELDFAQLRIEHLILYYGCMRSLEGAISEDHSLYTQRSLKVSEGVMKIYQEAPDVILPLGDFSQEALATLFNKLDEGSPSHDLLSDRIEKAWKQAWDLYFRLCDALGNQPLTSKKDLVKYLSSEPLYP